MGNERRPDNMVRITTPELADAFIEEQVKLVDPDLERLGSHEMPQFMHKDQYRQR